jgi:hypothetical protein
LRSKSPTARLSRATRPFSVGKEGPAGGQALAGAVDHGHAGLVRAGDREVGVAVAVEVGRGRGEAEAGAACALGGDLLALLRAAVGDRDHPGPGDAHDHVAAAVAVEVTGLGGGLRGLGGDGHERGRRGGDDRRCGQG